MSAEIPWVCCSSRTDWPKGIYLEGQQNFNPGCKEPAVVITLTKNGFCP